MHYKISLSDNSFIIADEDYSLTLFFMLMKKTVTVNEYLSTDKYKKYYLMDRIKNELIKRTFTIEETDSTLPVGKRYKLAKDIQCNDLVMGSDNNPREVKNLHTGTDDMFEINVDGETYTVNGGHILALVDKDTGEHLEMPVNVFMHMNEEFQSHWVMEKILSNL